VTPSARLQAAIEILEQLDSTAKPADRFLRDWFRTRRYAGSKDRAAVAARVFAILRRRAALGWRMGDARPRALGIASVLAEGAEVDALFNGEGYGPAPLDDAERAVIASPPPGEPPLDVQGEFPAFLESELRRGFGDELLAEMRALGERAPVDLRVNTLKAKRDEVLTELQMFGAEPTPYAPHGIRIASGEGLAAIGRHAMFAQGLFEFQDEAAQIASLLCAARPRETVLDLAAGAGGKALALAAEMQNQGAILASDIDPARLAQLGPRATRAGASIIRTGAEIAPAAFDAVFVDAPCSGSGAWRRQPENKWRLTPARLAELNATQDLLLDQAATAARPGGRIVYATCSVLPCENEDRVAAFRARHPQFRAVPASAIWREATACQSPPGMDAFFRASPLKTGTDGFFAAIFRREA
jgi:16S rRNA (cytosine967-C5)-methyltransferase